MPGNKRGMTINMIIDPLVAFDVRVISHKFYQSSRPNSVPCIAVNLGYKLVKKTMNMICPSYNYNN